MLGSCRAVSHLFSSSSNNNNELRSHIVQNSFICFTLFASLTDIGFYPEMNYFALNMSYSRRQQSKNEIIFVSKLCIDEVDICLWKPHSWMIHSILLHKALNMHYNRGMRVASKMLQKKRQQLKFFSSRFKNHFRDECMLYASVLEPSSSACGFPPFPAFFSHSEKKIYPI